jgi:hypothetical protein
VKALINDYPIDAARLEGFRYWAAGAGHGQWERRRLGEEPPGRAGGALKPVPD